MKIPRSPNRLSLFVRLSGTTLFGACSFEQPVDELDDPAESVASAEEALTCVTIDVPGKFLPAIQDAAIATDPLDPSKANANFGLATALYTGSAGTEYRRIVMKFDLAAAPIPPGDTIVSGSLALRMAQSLGQAPVDIYAGTALWSEQTVTWNTLASAPGGGLGALLGTLPTAGIPAGSTVTINVPASVINSWVDPSTNYGLVLDHPAPGRTVFGSEQGPYAVRPKLTICSQAPTCFDGIQNGGESDVDCGTNNFCAPCGVGQGCFQDADCQSYTCIGGLCAPAPSCNDGIQNQQETGVDCGGGCPTCPNGTACIFDNDCSSGSCVSGICSAVPTCSDGLLNQGESDVDCGGPCGACSNGQVCLVATDCQSGYCGGGLCAVAPTCSDGVQNQGETGVDCGGPCAACSSCNDGIQNQGETGVDCGGPCAACASCNDGIQNQGETGVDCGGPCAACVSGGSHLWSLPIGSADALADYERVAATAVDGQGNVYVGAWIWGVVDLGSGALPYAGSRDVLLAKYSAGGSLLWAKTFGASGDEQLTDIAVTPAGDLYASVVYSSASPTPNFGGGSPAWGGVTDAVVLKFDTNGGFVWQRVLNSAFGDDVHNLAVDSVGNVIYVGYVGSSGFVQKFTKNNTPVWQKSYSAGAGGWVFPTNVDISANDEIAFTGYYGGSPNFGGATLVNVPGRSVGFLAKLSSAGSHAFSKALFDVSGDIYAWHLSQDPSGNVVVGGSCSGSIDYGAGATSCLSEFLVKFDGTGAPVWFDFYWSGGSNQLGGIDHDALGNMYVTGHIGAATDFGAGPIGSYPAANRRDAFVVKFDPNQTVVWQLDIPGHSGLGYYKGPSGRAIAVDPTGSGVLVAGGFTGSADFGGGTFTSLSTGSDGWLAKYAP